MSRLGIDRTTGQVYEGKEDPRLYRAALALAFPHEKLGFAHLQQAVSVSRP
jgi:hypothetical protein